MMNAVPRYMTLILTGLAATLGIIACAPVTINPEFLPPAENLARRTGADQEALALGRKYFLRDCIICHSPVWPHKKSPKQWRMILHRHRGLLALSPAEFNNLELYILTANKNFGSMHQGMPMEGMGQMKPKGPMGPMMPKKPAATSAFPLD